MTLSPRQAGRAGRHDGYRLYGHNRLVDQVADAVLTSHQLRAATDEMRRLYRYAFREGWSLAAALAAHKSKEEA